MTTIKQLLETCSDPDVRDVMNRFNAEPYDFNIVGPESLEDDPAVFTIYLTIGTASEKDRQAVYGFTVEIKSLELIQISKPVPVD